jgi:hypothetical protein
MCSYCGPAAAFPQSTKSMMASRTQAHLRPSLACANVGHAKNSGAGNRFRIMHTLCFSLHRLSCRQPMPSDAQLMQSDGQGGVAS